MATTPRTSDDHHPPVNVIRYLFAPPLVALSFLTLLPVGLSSVTDAEVSRSRGWYPVVGLLYGLILAALLALLTVVTEIPFPPLLIAALLVVTPAVLNRFLHLDGLMDFCDAMWGGRTVERRLEIMRDSRVGSFAVAGCFCVLLVKFSALYSVWLWFEWLMPSVALFPIASRWTMTLLLTVFPYGRTQGIGSAFAAGDRPWLATGLAGLFALAAAWFLLGPAGVATLIAVSLLAWLLGLWAAGRLGGGLTGDCYGAANEIMEAAGLSFLVFFSLFPTANLNHAGYGGGLAGDWLASFGPHLASGWYSYSE